MYICWPWSPGISGFSFRDHAVETQNLRFFVWQKFWPEKRHKKTTQSHRAMFQQCLYELFTISDLIQDFLETQKRILTTRK